MKKRAALWRETALRGIWNENTSAVAEFGGYAIERKSRLKRRRTALRATGATPLRVAQADRILKNDALSFRQKASARKLRVIGAGSDISK